MRLSGFIRTIALGAPLTLAACGGVVSRGDTSAGSRGGATASGDPSPSAQPATSSAQGSTTASAVGSRGNAAAWATSSVGLVTTSSGWATTTAGWATSAAGSTSSWNGVGQVTSTTSSGNGVGQATSTTSIGAEYSQNAPITATTSSQVTCYGATDGTSCLVSDINYSGAGPVHSVTCSKATGLCSCVVTPNGAPFNGSPSPDTVTATYAFTAGLCPMGAPATTPYTIGDLPASTCTAYGGKLFAICGW